MIESLPSHNVVSGDEPKDQLVNAVSPNSEAEVDVIVVSLRSHACAYAFLMVS